jgi:hypothetical protein
MPHMTQRNRKLIGTFLLLGSIIAWSVLATWIYLALPEGLPALVLIIYFMIAGMGWLLPSMALVKWMARPDAGSRIG